MAYKARQPVFEYWQSSKDKQWRWHVRAGNGEIIASGEAYKRKSSVFRVHALICGHRLALIEVHQLQSKPKHFEGKLSRQWP